MAASNTSTGVSRDWVVFRGPEDRAPEVRDLKRIQIDIRRNLPEGKIKDVPVSRELGDPLRFTLPRSELEGVKPMFSRDYIKANAISEEKLETVQKVRINIAPLAEYENKLSGRISGSGSSLVDHIKSRARKRERSPSPLYDRETSPLPLSDDWRVIDHDDDMVDDEDRGDIRSRLGGREKSPKERRDVRERLGVSVRDRLGGLGDQHRETEDYRDTGHRGHRGYRGGRGYHRGRGRGRGGYRGRGRRPDYIPRRSDDWTHDMYHQEEPSSTTD